MKRVVFVTGATATGKSEWALNVATEAGAVIVNCDSVQVYRGPVIGSNVPSEDELARADHYLYAHVDPPREMTAGDYRLEALALLKSLPDDARVFVVGGTGFYFQALEKGMFAVPDVPEEVSLAVRRQGESAEGLTELYRELGEGDAASAAKLSPNDSYRISRAVELLRIGIVPSERKAAFKAEPFPYPLLKTDIVDDRSALNARIALRTKAMLARGLVEETRGLLDRGLESWAPLQAVGYKQAVRFLRGGLSAVELESEITLRTVQLARRQENWFKRDTERTTFARDGGFAAFRERSLRFFEGADRLGPS